MGSTTNENEGTAVAGATWRVSRYNPNAQQMNVGAFIELTVINGEQCFWSASFIQNNDRGPYCHARLGSGTTDTIDEAKALSITAARQLAESIIGALGGRG